MKRRVKKLTLSRETLVRLDSKALGQVAGGITGGAYTCTCPTYYKCPSVTCSGTPICPDY